MLRACYYSVNWANLTPPCKARICSPFSLKVAAHAEELLGLRDVNTLYISFSSAGFQKHFTIFCVFTEIQEK